MMIDRYVSILFAGLVAMPVCLQIGLACGASWGRFALGGLFPTRLPPVWRALAVLQAGILVAMAISALWAGGVLAIDLPDWTIGLVTILCCLTFLANAASRSIPERRLWAPVTLGMFICACVLTF